MARKILCSSLYAMATIDHTNQIYITVKIQLGLINNTRLDLGPNQSQSQFCSFRNFSTHFKQAHNLIIAYASLSYRCWDRVFHVENLKLKSFEIKHRSTVTQANCIKYQFQFLFIKLISSSIKKGKIWGFSWWGMGPVTGLQNGTAKSLNNQPQILQVLDLQQAPCNLLLALSRSSLYTE